MTQMLIVSLIFLLGPQAPKQSGSLGASPLPPMKLFSRVLAEAKNSGVAVLLPSELPYYVDPRRVHDVNVESKEGSYTISLHYSFECADSCLVGKFAAVRRENFDSGGRRKVSLANGIMGYYSSEPCGSSCPPAEIEWIYKGALYSIQFAPDEASSSDTETALVKLANSCIEAGPR